MSRRDCESIRPLISAFFDGELTPSESMALHKHLALCGDCRRVFDEYQRIRTGFRDLTPSPPPPPDLARSIWSETIDRPPASRSRRLLAATSLKVGLSTAAALAVLIIISAVLLVRGYNQGLTPAVSSSVPLTDQNWPVYQPIKIQFTKPMDHASVENNLQIWPPGERSRIPMSWDNNTLILGSSTSQSTLFLPDTTYQVVVLATAKDSYGNPLGKTFSLSFRTSPIVDTAKDSTPTPQPTPNASPTPGTGQDPAIAQQSTVPSSSVITPPSQSTPQNVVPTATATATPIPTATPTAPAAIATSPSSVVNTPVPTPTQQPTAAATTPTPSPVATPTETPAATVQPAATPTTADLAPVATPVATATAASGTPTASVIPVTGAFGSVYWAFTDVQTKLGAPLSPEAAMNAAELGFQRGTMYERYDQSEIYVFFSNRQWTKFQDTWTAADGTGGGPAPEDQLWIPKRGFGLVWNSDPNLESSIGYAIAADEHVMGGVVQQFTNGIMLYSDQGFVYVVYDNGTWQLYPDTSGHGDLITPTPVAGETPTSTATPTATPDATPVSPTATP